MEEAIELAKFLAAKALLAIGGVVYRSNICKDPDQQSAFMGFFCKSLGTATGAAKAAWQQDVTNRLVGIKKQLDDVISQLDILNKGVAELLKQTQLLQLEIDKILEGLRVYQYLQNIQSQFESYMGIISKPFSNTSDFANFFSDVITKFKIADHLGIIKTAITTPLVDKDPLLHTVVKEINLKIGSSGNSPQTLIDYYDTYEAYVSAILLEVQKGFVLYDHALVFFETQAELSPDLPKPELPHSSKDWVAYRDSYFREIIACFNKELIWLIITLSWEEVGGNNPRFLVAGSDQIWSKASRFSARMLGEEYGLRGAVLSMGDRFDGAVNANGVSFPVTSNVPVLTDETDWWIATKSKGIYDEFRLSGSWTVYFYSMPAAAPGTYRLSDSFPYAAGPVEVTPIDEMTGKPVTPGSSGAVNFGYFLEVERAGGGFALLSGGWDSFNFGPVTWAPDGHDVALKDPNYSIDYVGSTVLTVGLSSGSTTIASTNAFDVILASGGPVKFQVPGESVYGATLWVRFRSHKTISTPEGGLFEVACQLRKRTSPPAFTFWRDQWPSGAYHGPRWGGAAEGDPMISSNDELKKILMRKIWYTSGFPGVRTYGCYMHPHVDFFFSEHQDNDGLTLPVRTATKSWDIDIDSSTNKRDDYSVDDESISFTGVVDIEPATQYTVWVQPSITAQIETSGINETAYFAYLAFEVANLKISRTPQ